MKKISALLFAFLLIFSFTISVSAVSYNLYPDVYPDNPPIYGFTSSELFDEIIGDIKGFNLTFYGEFGSTSSGEIYWFSLDLPFNDSRYLFISFFDLYNKFGINVGDADIDVYESGLGFFVNYDEWGRVFFQSAVIHSDGFVLIASIEIPGVESIVAVPYYDAESYSYLSIFETTYATVLSWVGDVVSSLVSGDLRPLLWLFLIPVGAAFIFLASRFIKRFNRR